MSLKNALHVLFFDIRFVWKCHHLFEEEFRHFMGRKVFGNIMCHDEALQSIAL